MFKIGISRIRWIRYLLSGCIIVLLFTAYRIITVEGEPIMPKFVLMRLEDIGPGGQYATMDDLGKLRAVLEFLQNNHAAFHLAVIPRWIDYPAEGGKYDVSLDQKDNAYVRAFNRLLHQAQQNGAVVGMHGYTHQVGNARRADGHQESGIGNEFNSPGDNETMSAAFAKPRMLEGLRIMESAGFHPTFWEAPHYRSTSEQDAMFRNYFGLNYQAEVQNHRSAPAVFYMNQRNTGYGVPTLGSVYVPTPFDYIAYNKDERVILDRLGKTNNINSFFYHPFLEFKQLIPVTDDEGRPVIRDGLPEYAYPVQEKTNLQKLLAGLKAKDYRMYTIHDYVPFTPAQSVVVGSSKEAKLAVGDVTGDKQADLVRWDTASGDITVVPCDYKRARNEQQPQPQKWARIPYANGAAMTLYDTNGSGISDLYVFQPSGKLEVYTANGAKFVSGRSWAVPPGEWNQISVQKQPNGDVLVAALSQDRTQLGGVWLSKGAAQPLKPYLFRTAIKTLPVVHPLADGAAGVFISKKDTVGGLQLTVDTAALAWKMQKLEFNVPEENGEIRFGDFNGDGLEDILRWDAANMRYTVYLRNENGEYRLLSTFGPWGKSGQRLLIADFDGNGKMDIGIFGSQDPYLDIALSFESI
ncbi:DUF2334 domain-containing protein [Paenibacillus thalictri]|uniref:DUF2334 domain-containing protein n=1 Tax=Paenibacillus thalictri TaxID=2527873 RepID=A0A4Q9DIK3_9BACL|nr:DUF2334 domain-containing protein [Paenibacillus thalictri]TBL70081.1 DUF2334 domain-containing protein [Paenibacillus thalictri]